MKKLFFDEYKNKALTQVLGQDKKYHRKTLSKKHIKIVAETNVSYFSHTTPKSGSSKVITDATLAGLKELNVNTDYIQVLGCDGTNSNTRQMTVVIQQLEKSFNHPLQ